MRALAAAFVLLVVAGSACHHEEGLAVSTATTTGAVIVTSDTAIDEITTVRCSREVACNNAGVGPYVDSYDACITDRARDARAVLPPERCPDGLLDTALETCVRDIKNTPCEERIDTLERVMSCRTSKVCR